MSYSLSSFSINEKANAKLNLYLEVTGKNSDTGLHYLKMFNVLCDLYDEVKVEVFRDSGDISFNILPSSKIDLSNDPAFVDSRSNLAVRAAKLILDRFGLANAININLEKNIPAGGGLAGGSSNAAAVFRAVLTALRTLNLIPASDAGRITFQEQVELALTLGADVPYLLRKNAAIVEGYGEVISLVPVKSLEGMPLLLIFSGEHSSTASVFKSLDYPNNVTSSKKRFISSMVSRDVNSFYRNDLEEPALNSLPIAKKVVMYLRELTVNSSKESNDSNRYCVGMSGSGSTIYILDQEFGETTNGGLAEIKQKLEAEFGDRINIVESKIIYTHHKWNCHKALTSISSAL